MFRTENHTPTRPSRRSSLIAITVTVLLLVAGSASAASNIEGVWSFNGGQIAIQPEGNGQFVGIVVLPTTFATCPHEVGEPIWTQIAAQPDGSYQGRHQWFFEPGCAKNPELGPTAWRVVEEPNGSRYLRVCLSTPGGSQPTIPVGSPGVGASYGCLSSGLTAPLATSSVGTFKQVVTGLPPTMKCVSGRKFLIHIHDAKYDPFKTVVVTLKGHKLKVVHRGSTYIATVNLKGLPVGAFTVKIKGLTVRGHTVSGTRTFHTCAKKPIRPKPKKRH
jgi:hypothetical protein